MPQLMPQNSYTDQLVAHLQISKQSQELTGVKKACAATSRVEPSSPSPFPVAGQDAWRRKLLDYGRN